MSFLAQHFSGDSAVLAWLVIGALLVAILAMLMVVVSYVGSRRELQQLATKLQIMEKQAGLMSSGSLGLGQRLISLEKKLHSLQEQQHDIRQSDLEFSYTQAQKLIEQGIDAQTVAANSGLSASEIGLMQMLHKQAREHVA
ncbi:DUF2802 domain-containing protein [Teredinibacter haidensis]|uniref:DUF2802 domain-containing protein n=1 Tax=Teredinibacter haidensis TaxID=2731755 RepID=UPI0009490820|nr:DUF2802 domain-containing protein [Teredinibacter haidensis]